MVKVVLGCMTFGREGAEQSRVHDLKAVQEILDVFKKHGYDELDTARMYGAGSSEEYLSQLDVTGQGFNIATKNFPSRYKQGPGVKWHKLYDHTPAGIRESMQDSLAALGTKKVDLYYLHAPDRTNPFEDTVRALKEQYDDGRFARWGLSNYTAKEVEEFVTLSEKHGLPKPAVYQGVYSAICRSADPELIDVLRKHGIAYYIFNPLGGGFFVGNYSKEGDVEAGSRFDPKRGQGVMYRARYWNDAYFNALEKVKPVCQEHNVTLPAAALRWLQHHSQLDSKYGDAIIIGASSLKHIDQNLIDLEGEPLPDAVVKALDAAWEEVKAAGAAPKYHH